MALSINKATVGYSQAGVQKLLRNVHAQVILTASSKMKNGLSGLNKEVDTFWRGKGAEQFKKNMASDVNNICAALNTAYNSLESEINAIVNAMGKMDSNLVKRRK